MYVDPDFRNSQALRFLIIVIEIVNAGDKTSGKTETIELGRKVLNYYLVLACQFMISS